MSTPEPTADKERLLRMLDPLLERARTGALRWEPAVPPDSYATNIEKGRFRIRSQEGNQEPPYVLELLLSGNVGPTVTTTEIDEGRAAQITELYEIGRARSVDPSEQALRRLEETLGLRPE
jgi:hypothetical protein